MTESEAELIVARYIAVDVLVNAGLCWEDYPDLSEHIWDEVCSLVRGFAPPLPPDDQFSEAYNLLARKADQT